VMIRIQDSGWVKRKLFFHFLEIAKVHGKRILDGEKVGLANRLHYALGSLLIYRPLLNTLGLTRVKLGYTAGAAIGPDIFDFYRSIGFNLKQLYGMTEGMAGEVTGEVRLNIWDAAVPASQDDRVPLYEKVLEAEEEHMWFPYIAQWPANWVAQPHVENFEIIPFFGFPKGMSFKGIWFNNV